MNVSGSGAKSSSEPATWGALFVGFLKVSLCGFGGGLVWARRIVVERKRGMDEQEFAETLTLCQFMPGPNIVGITVCVGSKLRGSVGAITAVAGFILIPWTIGLSLGALYLQYAHVALLQKILGGLSAAAAANRDRHQVAVAASFPAHGIGFRHISLCGHRGYQATTAHRPAWVGAAQYCCGGARKRVGTANSWTYPGFVER